MNEWLVQSLEKELRPIKKMLSFLLDFVFLLTEFQRSTLDTSVIPSTVVAFRRCLSVNELVVNHVFLSSVQT